MLHVVFTYLTNVGLDSCACLRAYLWQDVTFMIDSYASLTAYACLCFLVRVRSSSIHACAAVPSAAPRRCYCSMLDIVYFICANFAKESMVVWNDGVRLCATTHDHNCSCPLLIDELQRKNSDLASSADGRCTEKVISATT